MGLTLRKKRYLSMVSWQNIEHTPPYVHWGCSLWYSTLVNSKEIFYMFYIYTSMTSMRPPWPLWDLHDLYETYMTSMRPPWPLWPPCLPWPILINSSINSHNSLFVSDSQNIKLQGYPQRMRLQRRLHALYWLNFLIFMHPFFLDQTI